MNRPRPDEIDPLVPDMSSKLFTDGGILAVARSSDGLDDRDEVDAPLVPDLS